MALPTDNTFGDKGNPARTPPPGPTALGSALDANFAACAPIVNTTNYPASSGAAVALAGVATGNGAADNRLANVNMALVSDTQIAVLSSRLTISGVASITLSNVDPLTGRTSLGAASVAALQSTQDELDAFELSTTNALATKAATDLSNVSGSTFAGKNFSVGTGQPLSLSDRFGETIDLYAETFGMNATATTAAINAVALANPGKILDGRGKTFLLNGLGIVSVPRMLRDAAFDMTAVTTSRAIAGVTGVFGIAENVADIWAGGYPSTTVATPAVRGDFLLAVASAAAFTAGRLIIIQDNTVYWDNNYSRPSQMVYIQSISGNTLTLSERLEYPFQTTATVRQMPTTAFDWENVQIIGDPTLTQVGVAIAHAASVNLIGVGTRDTRQTGLGIWNCGALTGGDLNFRNCDQIGYGYGLNDAGTSNVNLSGITASSCRHTITGGAGPVVLPLQRRLIYSNVVGNGNIDAVFDKHPGAVDVIVRGLNGRFQFDAATSGDAVTFNGAGLDLSSVNITGFRRHGINLQSYGDGDGIKRPVLVRGAYIESQATLAMPSQYGISYDDSNAVGAYDAGSVSFDQIVSVTRSGGYVSTAQNGLRNLAISNSYIAATDNGPGLQILSSANGTVGRLVMSGVHLKAQTTAGLYALDYHGISGSVLGLCSAWGCTFEGGEYGMASQYSSIEHASSVFISPGAGNTTVGTGGSIKTVTFA